MRKRWLTPFHGFSSATYCLLQVPSVSWYHPARFGMAQHNRIMQQAVSFAPNKDIKDIRKDTKVMPRKTNWILISRALREMGAWKLVRWVWYQQFSFCKCTDILMKFAAVEYLWGFSSVNQMRTGQWICGLPEQHIEIYINTKRSITPTPLPATTAWNSIC